MGRPLFGPGRHHPPSIDRNSRGESWGCWPIEMPDGMPPLVGSLVGADARAGEHLVLRFMESIQPKTKTRTRTSSRVLSTPVDKRGNACNVPSSIKADSVPAASVGGKIAKRSGGDGALSHSPISK